MKKLKVLNANLTSPFRNFKYKIGKEYTCKDFDDNPNNDCSNGFYATDVEGLPYSWNINKKCFEVEVSGRQVIISQYKQRFEKQTIIREVEKDELIELARKEEKRLGYKLSEVLFPVNPLLFTQREVTEKEIQILKEWASVLETVRASVLETVRASVWETVKASAWETVKALAWETGWASVWETVWASVWAYASSLFPGIEKWKYIEHEKGVNPFQSGIDLWRSGFVPSFDGEVWRLHSGKKAEIVYELKNY